MKKSHYPKWWKTSGQLAALVQVALHAEFEDNPQPGWQRQARVRAVETPPPQVAALRSPGVAWSLTWVSEDKFELINTGTGTAYGVQLSIDEKNATLAGIEGESDIIPQDGLTFFASTSGTGGRVAVRWQGKDGTQQHISRVLPRPVGGTWE